MLPPVNSPRPRSANTSPPELLAPGGDMDCIRAAVAHGADAVYFGLTTGLNARARAANVPPETLEELVATLHRRHVRAYLTFNTLVFPEELDAAERTVRLAISAGVDALIVQDLGLARLIREISPDVPIHASTQMTLGCAASIQAVQSLGISRVILPRELSLAEIAEIAEIGRETPVELEVFVHGAMCISYGGQCLASAALGGRSANRGQCAQACRLAYQLVCDGQTVELGRRRYLLSPHDLATYRLVPQLAAAGVSALKIEGRLKSAEYVAQVTRLYRQAIDAAADGKPFEPTEEDVVQLDQLFSRGFCTGWLAEAAKPLIDGRATSKRGVLLGRVRQIRGERVAVEIERPVRRGDGVVFVAGEDRAESEDQPSGGRVFEIFAGGKSVAEAAGPGCVELAFGHGAIDLAQLRAGDLVWKTDDPRLTAQLRKSYRDPSAGWRVPLDLIVEAEVGSPLRVTAQCATRAGCPAQSPAQSPAQLMVQTIVQSSDPLAAAEKHPLSEALLRQQFGRLGKTAYVLRDVQLRMVGHPMVPLSVLGALRHEIIAQLDAAATAARWTLHGEPAAPRLLAALAGDRPAPASEPRLHVLCRSRGQVEVALQCGAGHLTIDLADVGQRQDAVGLARAGGAKVYLATPRVQKPGEEHFTAALVRQEVDGLLVRNLAALRYCAEHGIPAVADASLNAANPLTVEQLHGLGAVRVTAAHDLDRNQWLALAAAVPPQGLEFVVHQHMPMFHTEYCLFCDHLSAGSSHVDCGRPCASHTLRLRDRRDKEHPVAADAACRNTVFAAVPQSAAEVVPSLVACGVRDFRIELLAETSAAETENLVRLYLELIHGRITGNDAWRALQAACPGGLTRGTLQPRKSKPAPTRQANETTIP